MKPITLLQYIWYILLNKKYSSKTTIRMYQKPLKKNSTSYDKFSKPDITL